MENWTQILVRNSVQYDPSTVAALMCRSTLILTFALLLLATALGCKPKMYKAGSSSMSPTITNGELVMADMFAFSRSTPRRWDVVVFRPPSAALEASVTQTWLMRIVALPGETVSFATGSIAINARPLSLPPHLTNVNYVGLDRFPSSVHGRTAPSPLLVPVDSYFVLGDNSTNASDSRFWGALPRTNILGKVIDK